MNDLLKKILGNPANEKVLDFLKIDLSKKTHYFKKWIIGRIRPSEGAAALLEDFGKEVPLECKYEFSTHTIMVHPKTGIIFAFNCGRYSMFFRCDFERSGLENTDKFRKGFTWDCIKDITQLGEDWAFLENSAFLEEEKEQLRWAFEKILRT